MTDLIAWIGENWMLLIGTAGTIVMAASIACKAIAPLTANTTDDRIAAVLDKIYKFLSAIALNPKVK